MSGIEKQQQAQTANPSDGEVPVGSVIHVAIHLSYLKSIPAILKLIEFVSSSVTNERNVREVSLSSVPVVWPLHNTDLCEHINQYLYGLSKPK